MKILVIGGIFVLSAVSVAYSQSKRIKFRDLTYVPERTVTTKGYKGDTLKSVIIKPSYIKEITNKEYREFVNDLSNHPKKEMVWSKRIYFLPNNVKKDSTLIFRYNEVSKNIIDTSALPFKDYFSNKKYDNYPVMGVSGKNANYFAAWKTKKELLFVKQGEKLLRLSFRAPFYQHTLHVQSLNILPISQKGKNLNNRSDKNYKVLYLICEMK